MAELYSYVGPAEIANAANMGTPRRMIETACDVRSWVNDDPQLDSTGAFTATFIIDSDGKLWIADRRSEHIACARRQAVLSAGEITFSITPQGITVAYVTNQSTGYCPKPESWPCVETALKNAGLEPPEDFDVRCEFRRCSCGQINIVKNSEYDCAVCGSELPHEWNFNSTIAK